MDYLIKILPNNSILVRNIATKEVKVLKANEVSAFFENVLEGQLKSQDEEDSKISEVGRILTKVGVRE